MSLPNFDIRNRQQANDSEHDGEYEDNGLVARPTARSRQRGAAAAPSSTWQGALGLHPRVSVLSLCALLIHFSSSILFLVFLNSLQPFYIAQLQDTPSRGSSDELPSLRIGLLTGKLAFSDELASIFLVLLWGAMSDRLGIHVVAAVGYCLISLGLVSYALARKPWPDLLWARLIFAGGGSAVTAMLTGE
jgi:MFS family permease